MSLCPHPFWPICKLRNADYLHRLLEICFAPSDTVVVTPSVCSSAWSVFCSFDFENMNT